MPFGMIDEFTPGSYTVSTGAGEHGEKHTFDAVDSFKYDGDGALQVVSGGAVVATFRWWESIIRDGD